MRDDFEQQILERPEDREKYAVYADWLTEQGDARGELIQLQLKLEDAQLSAAERGEVRAQEAKVLAAHARGWLGALAGPLLDEGEREGWRFGYRHSWRRGFLDGIEAAQLTPELVRALRASPETRFLTRLLLLDSRYIEDPVDIDGEEIGEDDSLVRFLRGAALGNLRELQLGGLDPGNCHTNGDGIEEVLMHLPRLERLHLEARRLSPGVVFQLELPLRQLTVYHQHEYPLERLAGNAAMASLESLRLQPHAIEPGDDEAYLRIEHVRALCASPHMQSLRHLELRMCSAGDEGIEVMLSSGMIGRLRVLDLQFGEVTDEGAIALAQHPDTRHLEQLDLTGNQLTAAGIGALREAGIPFVAEEQMRPGDPNREYLWRGDME